MLTREDLREIMNEAAAATKTDFLPGERGKDKAIRGALAGYAKGCRREDIIGLYDSTVFGSGKNGILLAVDGLYSSEFAHFPKKTGGLSKLPLAGICRVKKGGTNNAFLTVDYASGSQRVVYVGNVYDKPVIAILEGVIALSASAPDAPAPDPGTAPAGAEPVKEAKAALTFDEIVEEALAQPEPAAHKPPAAQPEPATPPAPKETPPPEPTAQDLYRAGGELYQAGRHREALTFLTQAGEKGLAKAQVLCASIYYDEGDDEAALHWALAAAKQGDVRAQVLCAGLYEEGRGTETDPEKALYWYLAAAEQGDAEAQFRCGTMYDDGLGTQVDRRAAMDWYLQAARQGHCNAQVLCGILYLKGEVTERNFAKAEDWLKKAARQGDESAQALLDTYF